MQQFLLNGNQFTEPEKTNDDWIRLTKREKVEAIEKAMGVCLDFRDLFIQSLSDQGELYVGSRHYLDAKERGGLLLDLEVFLVEHVDPSLRCWFEVTADKSKLRQLRGVSPVSYDGSVS